MLRQRRGKGGRRREEALLEQLEHELRGEALCFVGGALLPALGIGVQQAVRVAFGGGVGHHDRLQLPLRKAWVAVQPRRYPS